MADALEAHMAKEAHFLFPAIRRGSSQGIGASIAAIRADHADYGRQLAEIRRLTSNLAPPEGACSSWHTLYTRLAEFADDLSEHFRLENDVLFPRLERVA